MTVILKEEFKGMKILVNLGHPQKGSFNHAIANTAIAALKEANNYDVIFHNLYEEGFRPVINVE